MPNNDYANEPNQSRSEDIIQSILDNTEYDEPARSRIEYLLVELKNAIEGGGVTSYSPLTEKPKIDNHTLQAGNNTSSDLGLQTKLTFDSAPTENSTNPVTSGGVYTALGTKANSADVYNKSAVDTALTAKADKSTTYTKTEVDTALSSKQNTISDLSTIRSGAALGATAVQPVSGKGLSTNDYTTTEKEKLAGIEAQANKTTVDSALSGTSTNPVQNKVVKSALDGKQATLTTAQLAAVNSGITSTDVEQIETNKNNILSIQQEQIVQNTDIATLRLALDTKIYGIRIDKRDVNPDTRVTYLYDAVGMTPAYMDFSGGLFNYGSWADIWFIKNNRPVALKFDGTVDYELNHTDFTKKLDGTASNVSDPDYDGNFMSEMPTVYVKRWEDSRYNYIAFSDKQVNSDFLAQAHTNANGTVNSAIYLPMFKGWKDSNNKLRSLMGTYPTGDTTGTNEVTYASNNGTGWQIWDKAKIDLLMDLIMLITKSTNCRAKIGNGDCQTYNASDTTNYGKMKSGYETDGTTRSASAQFYGSEGTEVTNYGKHHMIAFYIEDLWGNRWDRCLGFNLVNNVYKVKMTPHMFLIATAHINR